MTNVSDCRCRLGVERLEEREVPAFLAPVTTPGDGPRVAVGDFNRDGYADVAAAGGRAVDSAVIISGKVTVRIGNGDGTFGAPKSVLGARGYYLRLIDVPDVNGDGHSDIRVIAFARNRDTNGATITATVFTNVWLGNGNGTFGKVSTTKTSLYWGWPLSWPPQAGDLQLRSDFNGDGTEDIASPDTLNNRVYVWLVNPDGTVQSPQTFAAGPNPDALAAGDFNGDGRIDLIVVNSAQSGTPQFSALLNDGSW